MRLGTGVAIPPGTLLSPPNNFLYMLLATGILLSALVLGLFVSFKLVPILIAFSLDRNLVDQPDTFRKRHLQPTPRIGGVGIFAGFASGLAYLYAMNGVLGLDLALPSWPLLAGATCMFGVGLWDDLRELGFKKKLVLQSIVAYLVYVGGVRFDAAAALGLAAEANIYLELPLTMLWMVGMMNAINFIDGLDGLAAGVSLIMLISIGALFGLQGNVGMMLAVAAVAGGILGFLVFNFNPASIFMGDSGSLLLGYLVGAFALQLSPEVMGALPFGPALVLLVVAGLPITDTSLSMVRRMVSGKSMCAPDRDHIHHRLSNRMPVRRAVVLLYLVTAMLGIVGVTLSFAPLVVSILLLLLTAVAGFTGLYVLGYVRPVYLSPRVKQLPLPSTTFQRVGYAARREAARHAREASTHGVNRLDPVPEGPSAS